MRYINPDDVERKLTPEWLRDAHEALVGIEPLGPDARHAELKRIRSTSIWQDLKNILADISYDKCWYCEICIQRADGAVDHYRPKNRVLECPTHEGYWWLAFSWKNYRYSCTYCNSRRTTEDTEGGKRDHFPLLEEADRAFTPMDDLGREKPCLLDPMRATDPLLIAFRPNGEPEPAYDEAAWPNWYKRAKESIHIYHLDLTKTKQARNELYLRIKGLVENGDKFFDRCATGDETAEDAMVVIIDQLAELLRPSAVFAAIARAYLMGFRGAGRHWVERILTIY